MTLETEVQSLRQVPMFREIDPARLKLLAFTSERVQFADGQRFFSQGDPSDAAFVILEGGEVEGELGQADPSGQTATVFRVICGGGPEPAEFRSKPNSSSPVPPYIRIGAS